jgi:hypothetical protein
MHKKARAGTFSFVKLRDNWQGPMYILTDACLDLLYGSTSVSPQSAHRRPS